MREQVSVRRGLARTRLLTLAAGAIVSIIAGFGLPSEIFLGTGPPADDGQVPRRDLTPASDLKELVARGSALESVVYPEWQRRYLDAGGDRNVVVGLGWTLGLATESSAARGRVTLDLVGGAVKAHVEGLGDREADLWLVDDSDAPGMSAMPEPGDRMVRVGRLEKGVTGASLTADLGPGFFSEFELDTVVVSPAGRTPAENRILLGTRPFFERVYTKTRLAAERSRPGGLRAFLASVLSPQAAYANSTQVLIAHGLVSQAVGDGADLFFRETFNGNGRTCGTCHPVANNLVVDAEFIATLPAADPIFIAEVPPQQGGVPGLERPALLRGFGLILENVDGLENPTVKFVMRGVPHSLSMDTSVVAPADGRAPVERTGWSGDGAPGNGALRLFPQGAVIQHFTKRLNRVAGVDFRLPTQAELDAMEAYMRATGRLNELNVANVSLTNAGAELGRRIFNNNNTDPTIASGKCLACHFNAGANTAAGTNNNFNTGVETVPHPARQVENFPFDGGFGTANRDCDGNGINDCFGDGTFTTPPLIEAADTAPFFHNNVAETLEDSVEFYSSAQFQASPSGQFFARIDPNGIGIRLTLQESADVAAFLRVINASFNVDMAVQRNDAGIALENSSPFKGEGGLASLDGGGEVDGKRETINSLLSLSNAESQDAIDVLTAQSLHADAVTLLRSAITRTTRRSSPSARSSAGT